MATGRCGVGLRPPIVRAGVNVSDVGKGKNHDTNETRRSIPPTNRIPPARGLDVGCRPEFWGAGFLLLALSPFDYAPPPRGATGVAALRLGLTACLSSPQTLSTGAYGFRFFGFDTSKLRSSRELFLPARLYHPSARPQRRDRQCSVPRSGPPGRWSSPARFPRRPQRRDRQCGRAATAAVSSAQPPPATSVDTLVVCPSALTAALEPWLQLRRGQGHRLRLTTDFQSADDIKAAVRETAAGGSLRYVVLVGDVVTPRSEPRSECIQVPTYLVPARVNVRWGSEPEIATDNWFADLDDDGLPELAVGRLPADSPADLTTFVHKIVNYEQQSAGLWCRRINLVAGVGGFGPVTDAVLETATRSLITQGIPSEYCTSMTYASWRSPYFPDPRSFRTKTLDRLNEGCLFWVYVGHGRREGLDWVHVPPGVAPILERDDVARVRSTSGLPVAIFLSCYTAAFDDREDCLAELLLQQEAGPVAVLGGSRVTLPYGMAVLGNALLRETFERRRGTLGEVLLHAKRTLGAGEASSRNTPWLDL